MPDPKQATDKAAQKAADDKFIADQQKADAARRDAEAKKQAAARTAAVQPQPRGPIPHKVGTLPQNWPADVPSMRDDINRELHEAHPANINEDRSGLHTSHDAYGNPSPQNVNEDRSGLHTTVAPSSVSRTNPAANPEDKNYVAPENRGNK